MLRRLHYRSWHRHIRYIGVAVLPVPTYRFLHICGPRLSELSALLGSLRPSSAPIYADLNNSAHPVFLR